MKFMLTSDSVGSFSEYATIERWFFVGSIYAEGEDYRNNSESENKTDGNHDDGLIYFQLI